MKKSFTALLAASLMLAGCASSAGSTANASSKTFTGSSTGMQGPVTVTLSVDGGKITNVELTEISETPSVASVAMERIPQQIVEHQTTTLDKVQHLHPMRLCVQLVKQQRLLVLIWTS